MPDPSAPPPSIFDTLAMPASAALLAWTLRALDAAAGTIEIAFTEAELFDEAGELVARATFSARAMRGDKAGSAR